ncbi:MAG: hypothetical protein C0594_15890 [Marinilabiliales bacterium]|nr:MAG: hypothetical protein C0594_15890 [Marinilabiliales bacterium]
MSQYSIIFRKFIFIVLCAFPVLSQAQNVVDSLTQRLEMVEGKVKVEVLNALAKEYAPRLSDSANFYAENDLQLAKELGDKNAEGRALYNFGYIAQRKGDMDVSVAKYNESEEIFTKAGNMGGAADALNGLGIVYKKMADYSSALRCFKMSLNKSVEANDLEVKSRSLNGIAGIHQTEGEFDEAIKFYLRAKEIKEQIGDEMGKGKTLHNIGNTYFQWGKLNKSMEYQQEALRIFEKINFSAGIGSCLNNMGIITENIAATLSETQDDTLKTTLLKAKEYYEEALEIQNNIGNLWGAADIYDNIGNILDRLGESREALEYKHKALDVRRKLEYKPGIASTLGNIGTIYASLKVFDTSLVYYEQALDIFEEMEDPQGIAIHLNGIGKVYFKLGDYRTALKYYLKSLKISKDIELAERLKDNYNDLARVYDSLGNYAEAYKYYKRYIRAKDSIINKETHKQIAELEKKYETEKKEQEIALLNKDKALQTTQIEQQRKMIIVFIVVSIIILIFLILVLRLFNLKKKANIELEQKNRLITNQKQEIEDSIHYAKRIQTAILPPVDQVNSKLPEHFILFKPKDIVSGDFHWSLRKGNLLIMTAADCTGHGVPGAFMSMLGVSFLNEIVNDRNITDSDMILNSLRESVINALQQKGQDGEQKDGMDMALSTLNLDTNELQFSGANNPLYLIRDGELKEIKGDKMPVSIHIKMDNFTRNDLQLRLDDRIYMFSDGYADQFGGPKGKKFKYKPFKKLLLESIDQSMAEQRELLDREIENWKSFTDPQTGEKFEQIDDICVIGLRIGDGKKAN